MSNESRELVTVQQPLSLTEWQVIQAIAPTMHQSRLFGVNSIEQAAAIMIKGAELGMNLSTSFELIQVIQGRPVLSPRGALAIVMGSGELAGFKVTALENPIGYTCWMKRRNGFEHQETFTVDDARRAGLTKDTRPKADAGDGGWEKYPYNMAKWRAVGFCIDILFADITGGMKRADEFGAVVDNAGNVVEGDWQAMPVAEAPAETPTQADTVAANVTLQDLVEKYGPDAVMAAAGGRIPGTLDEVTACAMALAA